MIDVASILLTLILAGVLGTFASAEASGGHTTSAILLCLVAAGNVASAVHVLWRR